MQCNGVEGGVAMAIQISKYQSAESSPVSLKFATKCIEGKTSFNSPRKKGDMSSF